MESISLKLAKKILGKKVEVTIDRPFGSRHPEHNFIYEVNYGYIDEIKAPDGECLDAYYLGEEKPLEKATGNCIAIIHRKNNDDDKLVVVSVGVKMTDKEIRNKVNFQEQYFESEIIRK